jgi:hypothetical protein
VLAAALSNSEAEEQSEIVFSTTRNGRQSAPPPFGKGHRAAFDPRF